MSTFNTSNPLQLAPEAEETTELDELLEEDIGGRVRAQKKGLRGIDDDSSDEEGQASAVKKKEANGHGDNDSDSDMFSEDDEDENGEGDKKENGDNPEKTEEFDDEKPQFMDMDKFEGDVGTHATVAPLDQLEESDSEVDIDYYTKDEVDGLDVDLSRAKKYAPKMESFNLKQDLEEGKFDQEGNFVKNAQDEKEHQDQWLDGVSKKDIAAAKRAQESRKESAASKPIVSKVDLLQQLSEVLQSGESSISALARLGKERKKLKGDEKKVMVQQIEKLTEYCDALLSRDMSNIYDLTREEVQKEYCLLTGQSIKDLKRKVDEIEDEEEDEEWVFRWAEGEEVHGPFTVTMMKGWSEGYFTDDVQVRKVGETTWMKHGKYE